MSICNNEILGIFFGQGVENREKRGFWPRAAKFAAKCKNMQEQKVSSGPEHAFCRKLELSTWLSYRDIAIWAYPAEIRLYLQAAERERGYASRVTVSRCMHRVGIRRTTRSAVPLPRAPLPPHQRVWCGGKGGEERGGGVDVYD